MIEAGKPGQPLWKRFVAGVRWYSGREWLRIVALVVCGIAARLPALGGALIWDDEYLVRSNPFIRSPLLIFETFRHYLFADASSPHYRPVQNISYCIDYLVWGGETYGYHISNLLWHLGSGLLLYTLLRRLLRPLVEQRKSVGRPGIVSDAVAFVVALLWLIHPAHSAAVDYISGRADSLAAFFACAAWLLYLRGGRCKSRTASSLNYGLAAVGALLALGSRESACIWVLLFVFHLFAIDRATNARAKATVFAAVVLLAALYIGMRHLPQARASISISGGSPAPVRLVLMLRALGDYGRVLLFPSNLHMERTVEAPEALLGNAGWRHAIAAEYLSIAGLATAVALCFGACVRGRARTLRAFGVGWFVIGFLPISNLIELNATVAEHWMYLPSIGFVIFLTGCAVELPHSYRRLLPVVAVVAVFALLGRSFVRSGDWRTAETFYRHSLAAGGAKPRMALNLALILTQKGDYTKAEPLLRKVVSIYPDYPIAINALAHALFRQGKLDEARKYFVLASEAAEKTRQDYPRTWIAALNIAHMHYRDHEIDQAIAVLDKARAEYPGTWELISYESELLREQKGAAAALPLVQEFCAANWWHADSAIAIGKLHSELGHVIAAEAAFRHASRLDVHAVEALNLIALLNVREHRLDAAFDTQRQAVSRQPDQPRQYLLLSDILAQMGRAQDSRAAIAQITRLQASVRETAAVN